ncbi:Hypothetical protein ACI5QM_03158 [Bacillus subtilis]
MFRFCPDQGENEGDCVATGEYNETVESGKLLKSIRVFL